MPGRTLVTSVALAVILLGAAAVPVAAAGEAAETATDHLLVRIRSDADRGAVHAAAGGRVAHHLDRLGVDVVDAGPAAAGRYAADRRVEWVEPNALVRIAEKPPPPPNDPYYGDLWNLHNWGQNGGRTDADIDAPEAWRNLNLPGGAWERTSSSTAVGIIDTGVQPDHPDLAGQRVLCAQATTGSGLVTSGVCADGHGHGTHVTGTVAAIGNDGTGVVGVAPTVGVGICKALNDTGSGSVADVAGCITYLVDRRGTHRLRVINLSLTVPNSSSTLGAAVDYAADRGVLLVAAAGNSEETNPGQKHWPAAYSSVVGVGATDRSDGHAAFSNVNDSVEISAPGVDIWSTVPLNSWLQLSGTSMAAPHVAAAAALLHDRTGLAGSRLRSALRGAVDDLGPAGRDNRFGYGRLNLRKALSLGGYVVDGWGGLHPFRSGDGIMPPRPVNGPYWQGWDIARGVASARGGGYVIDGWGGIHPFRTGGLEPAGASHGPYWQNWDIARGGTARPAGGGYIVDGWGGIHTFRTGGIQPPSPSGGPYWQNWDIARGVTLHPNGGGYIVDGWGGLHRFATGGVLPPLPSGGPYWEGWDIARGVVLLADGTGGYVVDGWGGLHPFSTGGRPLPAKTGGGPYWQGWDIARDAG